VGKGLRVKEVYCARIHGPIDVEHTPRLQMGCHVAVFSVLAMLRNKTCFDRIYFLPPDFERPLLVRAQPNLAYADK